MRCGGPSLCRNLLNAIWLEAGSFDVSLLLRAAHPVTDQPTTERAHTCRCGHTRDHKWVSAEPQYSLFHLVMGIFMGVSGGHPKSIRFRCLRCGQTLEESTDPAVIRAHR
jgi:hypothetical protein